MSGKVIAVVQQKGGSGKTTLAVNLAVTCLKRGLSVAILDTDPQGSLGRWFMTRRERLGEAGLEFSTSSAWGVSYECEKLKKTADLVIVDTPPKVDADLRPALREADLVLVPVASSHVDLWATEGEPVRVQGPFLLSTGDPGSGRTLAEQEGVPLIRERVAGTGRVAWVALDLAGAPFDAWAGTVGFWERLLLRSMPRSRLH